VQRSICALSATRSGTQHRCSWALSTVEEVRGRTTRIMARRRRRRPHGGQTTEAGSGRRRAPFSTDTASHTHTARSLACPLLTLSSSARSFSNGIFRSDGAPLLPSSDRSAGQRNQPSHSTVLARPVCLFVCVSAASLPCAGSPLGLSYPELV